MAKVYTFGNRKGGVAKTTTTAALSYLLSLRGYRVLATEVDSQGHLAEMLTLKSSKDFAGMTVFEAIQAGNVKPYVHNVTEGLDLLPANNSLAQLQDWLYKKGNLPRNVRPQEALKRALAPVQEEYDYILIDTPPALNDELINALTAATHIIGCTETSKPSMTGLINFFEIVKEVKESVNPDLRLCGVLATMLDARRTDAQTVLLRLEMDYDNLLFKTIIKRGAAIGRLYMLGFDETKNHELHAALKQFIPLVKEVLERE
ncbi:ParA family protein [Sporomusa sphaeroides]|uniref:Sporulation initiation inhibitor protein Soj n=1 Tax=Sporomusa sphaeroides DSM 2875 TaxID=1337886 RepID=A0A1U7MA65_9FIRM|nr:ParA family protein [Sporomusa sphaeroides]OLS54326.1 sporulation initiation inhibitor protein Soj [Sporomusa sphaeroides DSM 2875]CVK21555.1 Sporulation initiation inhibitor protein Soj [Sporomusa sphaeroides DSM 2875]